LASARFSGRARGRARLHRAGRPGTAARDGGLEELDAETRDQALELLLHETRLISANLANLAETELEAIVALSELGLRRQLLAEAIERGLDDSELG
jgi:hypothetical protein